MNIFKMCIQCKYNQFYITMISVKYEIEEYIMHDKKRFLGNSPIPKSWILYFPITNIDFKAFIKLIVTFLYIYGH